MFLKKIRSLTNTLLFRLTFLYAVIFTLSAFLAFSIFYWKIYTLTIERMDEELIAEVESYGALLAEEGLEGLSAAIVEEAESEDPEEEFYRVMTFDGEVIAATDLSSWSLVDKCENLAEMKGNQANHVLKTVTIPEQEYKARIICAGIGSNAVLQMGESLEEAEDYLQIFRHLFYVLLTVLMILSGVIGWFIARQAVLGMEQVSLTAMEISRGAYDKRVQIEGQLEEVKRLGSTFNMMLDRIQTLLKSMREMNDNIAHDLRSPIARIRGIAEMHLMDGKSIDDYQNMAAGTIEECDNLIDMINTMLDITETEAGVSESNVEQLDLTHLILEAKELFQPIADEKRIDVKVNLSEKLIFQGDRKKLQRIVSNLLENAIKYTPDGGSVSISVSGDGKKLQMIFEDTGVGISAADLPHIFERFYRCDQSRTQGGIGLGLSLVKAFVEAMNGAINVKSEMNKGSKFAITLSY